MSREYKQVFENDILEVSIVHDIGVDATFRRDKKNYKAYRNVDGRVFTHEGRNYAVLKVNKVYKLFLLEHICNATLAPKKKVEYIFQGKTRDTKK